MSSQGLGDSDPEVLGGPQEGRGAVGEGWSSPG